jgi:hypothetical protein
MGWQLGAATTSVEQLGSYFLRVAVGAATTSVDQLGSYFLRVAVGAATTSVDQLGSYFLRVAVGAATTSVEQLGPSTSIYTSLRTKIQPKKKLYKSNTAFNVFQCRGAGGWGWGV